MLLCWKDLQNEALIYESVWKFVFWRITVGLADDLEANFQTDSNGTHLD
jgi:hypothetical protein